MTESRLKNRFAQSRFTGVDAAALLTFIAVWVYMAITVRYSSYLVDESGYIAIAERFVRGDRPLVDEWCLAQTSCLFLCLPYRFFVAVTGGTTGILLFLRYCFLAFNAVFFWHMYIRLREYKWIGLGASLLFAVYIPAGFFACNYYTVPVRLVMIACLILFDGNAKRLSLLYAGVLLASAVLFQPGLAPLYFLYSIAVWVRFFRQKKGRLSAEDCDPCLRVRAWTCVTLSVVLCAAAFLIWLVVKCGLQNLLVSFPWLFTDPAYDVFAEGNVRGYFFRKFLTAAQIYSPVCWIPALVILALSAVYACGRLHGRQGIARKILFGAACIVWVLSCILPFRSDGSLHLDLLFSMYPAPMMWFGLACFLLCERRNKRFLFFWITALLFSLCVDVLSYITISLGSPIAFIANLVFFTDLVRELRAEGTNEKIRSTAQLRERKKSERLHTAVRIVSKATCVCLAVWFVFTFVFWNVFFPGPIVLYDKPFSFPRYCDEGPCKGIHYPEGYGDYYSAKLADIDTIRARNPKNLYICGSAAELYLYAGLPYATYSPLTAQHTLELVDRHVQYWKLHPERLPECIYVPFDNAYNRVGKNDAETAAILSEIRSVFDPICTYTPQMGQSGYILYVTGWTTDAQPAS